MNDISDKIIALVEQARYAVVKNVNSVMVLTYYHIGKMLVEERQQGEKRAEYGTQLLANVSNDLTKVFGKGFSVQNLERMRNFFLIYSNSSNVLRNSDVFQKSSTLLRNSDELQKSSTLMRIFNSGSNVGFLPISWSHYSFLIRIKDEVERQFYEVESFQNQWSVRELERQFNTGLFERLAVSKNKSEILRLAKEGQIVEQPKDLIKEPLILDFLGFESKNSYTETDLETAIINQIEKFMFEMGKGFFFGGRQVRFSFNEEHYFVDLVFYNRFLKCFVLIDLKIGKLKHQDLGQMQMYVNYYDRFVKQENENKTVGIIICKTKEDAIVEITLPEDNHQIFASQYETILPDKKQLVELIKNYHQ
ncbi:MAG: PDDEXK nuclease domain-containing protein [Lentimicrobiaceae bacterium]|nr:PDDEXK nuclease domain-containing protein [Lentimicrobiaceae bacterium]